MKNGRIHSYDQRRDIIVPGDAHQTVAYCVQHFLDLAKTAIIAQKAFTVAVSGGSTPNAIFEGLAKASESSEIDWTKVHIFWSDERSVPPTDKDSNYHMAMEAGLKHLPIPVANIHRMVAEDNIEENAKQYEELIIKQVAHQSFDLVMLGMGEDGHTASLFPKTHGLQPEPHRLVIANYVPQKQTWRMSLTYKCINQAKHVEIYLIGLNKAEMFQKVLLSPYNPSEYPIQHIGTAERKALFIVDQAAASKIVDSLTSSDCPQASLN